MLKVSQMLAKIPCSSTFLVYNASKTISDPQKHTTRGIMLVQKIFLQNFIHFYVISGSVIRLYDPISAQNWTPCWSAMKMVSKTSEKKSQHYLYIWSMIPRVWSENFEKVSFWLTLMCIVTIFYKFLRKKLKRVSGKCPAQRKI